MERPLLEDSVGDVLATSFAEVAGEAYVVNPVEDGIADLVFRLHDRDDAPTVRLLAAADALKGAMADFVVAGHAADLVERDRLAVRVLDDDPRAALVVSADVVVSLVGGSDGVGGLSTTDEAFVAEVFGHYERLWESAESYSLRTPPLSRVRETLATEIGEETGADFDRMLEAVPAARGDGAGLDEVTIAILVAARNGVLLYDVSKWGEDVGLASKATFSRTKSQLEDAGLIDTDKVPIDVGRPRLRLRPGDDELADADVPELASLAQERLEE